MSLDGKRLVADVDSVIKETHLGDGPYSHNLRVEVDNPQDMQAARDCLKQNYNNRFKISTEISIPTDVDSSENPLVFQRRTKYHVLMEAY